MWVQFSRWMSGFRHTCDPWQLPRVNAYATARCARDRSCGAQTLKWSCLVSTRSAAFVSFQSVHTSAHTHVYFNISLVISLFTCFVHVKEMKSTLFPISGWYPELFYWRWAETSFMKSDMLLWLSIFTHTYMYITRSHFFNLLMHLLLLWWYIDLFTSNEISEPIMVVLLKVNADSRHTYLCTYVVLIQKSFFLSFFLWSYDISFRPVCVCFNLKL